jgi:hypothetical protein
LFLESCLIDPTEHGAPAVGMRLFPF